MSCSSFLKAESLEYLTEETGGFSKLTTRTALQWGHYTQTLPNNHNYFQRRAGGEGRVPARIGPRSGRADKIRIYNISTRQTGRTQGLPPKTPPHPGAGSGPLRVGSRFWAPFAAVSPLSFFSLPILSGASHIDNWVWPICRPIFEEKRVAHYRTAAPPAPSSLPRPERRGFPRIGPPRQRNPGDRAWSTDTAISVLLRVAGHA